MKQRKFPILNDRGTMTRGLSMMGRNVFMVLLVVCSVLLPFPALAFYCGNKLVSEGDSAAQVLLKCGEPTRKEVHREKIIKDADSDREHRFAVTVENWFYNFGPQRWLYQLTFRNGSLVRIDTLGYGLKESEAGKDCDKGRRISVGDTILQVLHKCGEPLYKDIRVNEIRKKSDKGTEHRVSIVIEEWTYNFGPLAWIYMVRFENGKAVDIKTQGYGY